MIQENRPDIELADDFYREPKFRIFNLDNQFYTIAPDGNFYELEFDSSDMWRAYSGLGDLYLLSQNPKNPNMIEPQKLFSNWEKYPELHEYKDNSLVFMEVHDSSRKVLVENAWLQFEEAVSTR